MPRFAELIFILVLLSGCTVAPPLDVSTGDETALVKHISKGLNDCRVFPNSASASAASAGPVELTIDAGPTTIIARCQLQDLFGNGGWSIVPFRFVAETGHIYELRKQREGPNCLALVDTSAGDHIIACEPYYSKGSYGDYTSSPDYATLSIGKGKRSWSCELQVVGEDGVKHKKIAVDAGPTTIDATCLFGSLFIPFSDFNGRSRFKFLAESGHTYSFSVLEKKCISLVDVTSQKMPISCEPYQEIK